MIAQHVRSQRLYQHTTKSAHMPIAHAAYKDATLDRIRRCQGILSLQKRYGEQRLERACGIALRAPLKTHLSVAFLTQWELGR